MGDKAKDLLELFNLKEDRAKEYKTVKAKFEEYRILLITVPKK